VTPGAVENEALMPASGLAPGSASVFLVRFGVQEHGKVAADWAKPGASNSSGVAPTTT
jgi:hypothetical protein